MKKTITLIGALILSCALTFVVSCSKSNSAADDTNAQSQNASDDARVNSELENVSNEANSAVSGAKAFSGAKVEGIVGINTFACDVTAKYDSTLGSVTLSYDSSACSLMFRRTGSITISMPGFGNGTRWKDKNATITIAFNNYKVTRLSDGKSITFNGSKSITNLTGGLIPTLAYNASPVQHKITTNNLSITFDDGTQRKWSVYQIRTWSNIGPTSPVFQVQISSDTIVNGLSNVTMWGTNRLGNNFYVQLTNALTANSSCGWYKPTSGVRVITGISHVITETFGVDLLTGNPIGYTGTCVAEGFRINWTNANNQSKQVIFSY